MMVAVSVIYYATRACVAPNYILWGFFYIIISLTLIVNPGIREQGEGGGGA